ncbi:MAG TPA: carbohydrate ABC transporter permease [Clostridiales bacterium]|nr:carbohydrate ABC transporter permease [Clostridiales bacterium]
MSVNTVALKHNGKQRTKNGRERIAKLIIHLFLIIGSVIMTFPLIWLISSAFKPSADIFDRNFRLIPETFTFKNFVNGWNINPQFSFGHFFMNTVVLTILVVIGTAISSSLTAFGFARLKFKHKKLLFSIMLSTMMIPGQVTLIPQYLIFNRIGWLNSYLPMVVPAFFGGGAFNIFLLIQFIRGIPKELDESARIEGCSSFRVYWNIVMPLCKPALFTVVIFTFLGTWNDFMGQLIYLNSTEKFTVSLILNSLIDITSAVSWGAVIALTLLSVMPCILLFFVLQPYFVEGIATTGLKG